MVAKSRPALSALSAAFSQREVKKTYLAVVCGRCPLLPAQPLPCSPCHSFQVFPVQPLPLQPLS